MGSEGAKVLRELGNKVKKMEKLGQVDILYDIHEAAEELQMKIDKKSYLLVNSECWEIGSRPREESEPEDLMDDVDEERKFLEHKSLSEAVLDLRSVRVSESWDGHNAPNGNSHVPPQAVSSDTMIKQISWPARSLTFKKDVVTTKEEGSNTYESASSLSLATFTSLLIEFVARLQNLVDSFDELSEKANFKDPLEQQMPVAYGGFWSRLCNCMS